MNYWQTNFDKVRDEYAPVFNAIERALAKFDIDFYLIGAQSRDVWTTHLDIDRRKTKDIDYSVFINDHGTWQKLNEYLMETEKFERDKGMPYRFYLGEFTIDLIPFGGIANNDEVVLENPKMELSVYGCTEVTEEAVVIHGKYKVVTLPGLCIMKLIAFGEKPERLKDWEDLLFILRNYHEIAGAELFEGKHDDLITDELDFPVASARLLGRNMQSILNKNANLKQLIIANLTNKLQKFSPADIDQMYEVRDANDKQVETLKLVSELIKGIKD